MIRVCVVLIMPGNPVVVAHSSKEFKEYVPEKVIPVVALEYCPMTSIVAKESELQNSYRNANYKEQLNPEIRQIQKQREKARKHCQSGNNLEGVVAVLPFQKPGFNNLFSEISVIHASMLPQSMFINLFADICLFYPQHLKEVE